MTSEYNHVTFLLAAMNSLSPAPARLMKTEMFSLHHLNTACAGRRTADNRGRLGKMISSSEETDGEIRTQLQQIRKHYVHHDTSGIIF